MFDTTLLSRLVAAGYPLPAGIRAEVRWPVLLWPDRRYEVTGPRHRLVAGLDEEDRWRAEEAELLEQGSELLAGARVADLALRRETAHRAQRLAGFARARPAALLDRAPGERGAASTASRAARPEALTEVSEWAADEVALALGMSPRSAVVLLERCVVLVEQLSATWSALRDGRIGWEHAVAMVEVLGPMSTAEKRREAETRLLARVGGKSPAQLRAAARRVVLRIDAAAAARRAARAVAGRGVRCHTGEDGMGTLEAGLPVPVLRACYATLSAYADECRVEGDTRSKDERMADCLADLLLRPGATDRPPVRVSLTVVAPAGTLLGGDEPGEIDGEAVPAAVVRELAHTLGLLPRPQRATTDAEPTGPEVTTGDRPAEADVAALGALLGTARVAGTALQHRPHIAVTDELDGTLLALTDAAGIRRGQALGPPPESPGYRPGRELDRFVRLRDRRCRFPGCRARPRKCDLDHVHEHPLGPTAVCNLCALCEHHHRLKHQAPGWTLTGTADGGLVWTTPGGLRVTTRPPRFGADDDAVSAVSAAVPAVERIGRSRRREAPRAGRGHGIPGIAGLVRRTVDRSPAGDDAPPF